MNKKDQFQLMGDQIWAITQSLRNARMYCLLSGIPGLRYYTYERLDEITKLVDELREKFYALDKLDLSKDNPFEGK